MISIDLKAIELPDEHEARERSWRVVLAAYRELEPRPTPRSRRRPIALAVAIGATVALIAVAVSLAGSSLVRSVREAVGIRTAAPALTQLPAPGQLLIQSSEGPCIVQPDGSKRLLGSYAEASWSPHGLFVAVTRGHQLLAVDPHGTVRWSLGRARLISLPRWSPDGYRIAYLDGSSLRVVNGDGSGDHRFASSAAHVAAAWRPSTTNQHVFAWVTKDRSLVLSDADTNELLAHVRLPEPPFELFWTTDAQRLVAVSSHSVSVFTSVGRPLNSIRLGRRVTAAAVAPGSHRIALVLAGTHNEVVTIDLDHLQQPPVDVFSGGSLNSLAWSPNANWLLITWPGADQWVFVGTHGTQRIEAVSAIASQFEPNLRHRSFPTLAGWCCVP